jgi:DNA-binding transcriptional LysR family regulator
MRLRHIEIFHAVYVTGSVSGAAKALNVSQPTVSKVLKHAENQLGFALFHREKGRISPTEKGELLFNQTLPVFQQINELRKYAAMLSSTRIGQLRLAMTPAFSLEIVPRVLTQFSRKHSDVIIEVETLHAVEITKAVSNNATDIGLSLESTGAPGLKVTTIGHTRFVCVAPSSMKLPFGTLSIRDLSDKPLIQLNAKSPLGHMLNNRLREAWGRAPSAQIIAETYHLAKRLAAEGAGVAIVDQVTALSGNQENLRVHQISDLDPIKVDLITRKDDHFVGYRDDFRRLLESAIENF